MEGPPSRALATDRARAGNDVRVANRSARDAGVKKRGEDDDPAKLDLPGQHRGRQGVRLDEPHRRRRRAADAAVFRRPQSLVSLSWGQAAILSETLSRGQAAPWRPHAIPPGGPEPDRCASPPMLGRNWPGR